MKNARKIIISFMLILGCFTCFIGCGSEKNVGGGVASSNGSEITESIPENGSIPENESEQTTDENKDFLLENIENKAYKNMPIVEITTQDQVLPYNKEDYINCSFKISNCEDVDDNFSVDMKSEYGDEDCVGIRLRGNSTQNMPKKPYRIKFDKKKSLFGLEKNKSWVLLADYKDNSSIRNYAAFTLGNKMEYLDFTPTPHHVVLFLNGYYQGLYLLCEQVDEKEGRTNVESDILSTDINYPFLVEMDRNALSEGITGIDNFQPNKFYPIEIKYPEAEDRIEGESDIVFNYIQEYINAVFATINNNESVDVSFSDESMSFEDLVDVDSFIEYWLVNEVMFNQDSTWGSIYMHKTKDGKLKFGPNWDYDWSMSESYYSYPYDVSEIYVAQQLCILKYDTPLREFAKSSEDNFELICNKWLSMKSKVLETTEDLRIYKSQISSAGRFDAEYWYGETGAFQFDMQYDYVRLFLLDRVAYLDKTLTVSNYNTIFNI